MTWKYGGPFTVQDLWDDIFGNMPINDDDESEEQFLHFPPGTDRFEIWHWFEDTFGVSVAELMHYKEN